MGSGSSKSQTQQQSQQVKSEKIEHTPLIPTPTAAFLRPINLLSGRHLTEKESQHVTAIGKNRGI